MKTVQITVASAKGRTQETTWGIYQDRPYPSIGGQASYAKWENGGGVFPEYGRPAKGIGASFKAVLLREGYTPETATGDCKDYAGFVPYRETEPVPGAIVYRGRSLGETCADIDIRPHGSGVRWKVRGGATPTATEKALLSEQVAPALLAAIEEHKADLYAEAVDGIRETCETAIRDARAALDKLETEATEALSEL